MSKYKVSIIIPVYNGERYLEECLKSVLNQTLEGIEVIVVNDGSTDRSGEIISRYEKMYPNISVINEENKGIAAARTIGYCKSSGDYIGWVDNDDFVEPHMFERLYSTAINEEADYVYCDYSFYPSKVENKEKWFKEYHGVIDWYFIERNTHPWNKLVSRELCERENMDEKLPIFGDSVYVDLLVHAKKIFCIKEELYHYRVGHLSVSGSYVGKINYYLEVAKRARLQRHFIEDTCYKDSLKEYFEYRYIYSLIQVCVVASVNEDKKVYDRARVELKRIKYGGNSLAKIILQENFGTLKGRVLLDIIPKNYYISKLICKAVI